MQHHPARGRQAHLAHDLGGLAVGLAHVQRKRGVQLAGKRQLLAERLALHVARREVVVVIQAYLADAAADGLGKQAAHGRAGLGIEVLGVVRVAPHEQAHLRRARSLPQRVEHALGGPASKPLVAGAPPALKARKQGVGVAGVVGGVHHRHEEAHARKGRTRQGQTRVDVAQAREVRVALGDGAGGGRQRHGRALLRGKEGVAPRRRPHIRLAGGF